MERLRRAALAEFLRARRAGLSPAEVGLAPGRRRRTPGLRREEVALLSNVGVTWYTWLEQGRDINPSPEILGALASALRLDASGTAYLLRLGGHEPPAGAAPAAPVPAHLAAFVAGQDPNPSMVLDGEWYVREWNAAAEALLGYSRWPAADRNGAWTMFADTGLRDVLTDWEGHARRTCGELRESFAKRPNPRMAALLARLRADFAEAARWLDEPRVRPRAGGIRKEFRHPRAGELHLDQVVLTAPGGVQVVVMQPVPGREAETTERLRRLTGGVPGAGPSGRGD